LLSETIDQIRIPKLERGRPRTRPGARRQGPSIEGELRLPGVAPHQGDDPGSRQPETEPDEIGFLGRASDWLRPEIYKGRNIVERSFNGLKNWRGSHAVRQDRTQLQSRHHPRRGPRCPSFREDSVEALDFPVGPGPVRAGLFGVKPRSAQESRQAWAL
jgi:putative transposase